MLFQTLLEVVFSSGIVIIKHRVRHCGKSVAYHLLRVESEEVEVERLGGVPPGLLRPPSIEPFDL